MRHKIHTIGHSNTDIAEFIGKLTLHNIDLLIDIRSAPYSQFTPQFNQETVKKACINNNIDYLFLGHYLGGKPSDASVIDNKLHIDYKELSKKDYFLHGIDQLLSLCAKHQLCLMCAEGRPDKCHRHLLVAPALEKEGVEILHILPDGGIVSEAELSPAINKGQLALSLNY